MDEVVKAAVSDAMNGNRSEIIRNDMESSMARHLSLKSKGFYFESDLNFAPKYKKP